jgi:phosphoglycerate kinase
MAPFRTLSGLPVKGRHVLLRTDLDVRIEAGRVADASQLARSMPTLIELADKGARIVVMSSFGPPQGRHDEACSLQALVEPLRAVLRGRGVVFAGDGLDAVARQIVKGLGNGDVAVLENLQRHPAERENDVGFARSLAALGDLYVNDAVSCARYAYASTEAITRLLPAVAGRLMQREFSGERVSEGKSLASVAALIGASQPSRRAANRTTAGTYPRQVERDERY